jgi:hypothetical protein
MVVTNIKICTETCINRTMKKKREYICVSGNLKEAEFCVN